MFNLFMHALEKIKNYLRHVPPLYRFLCRCYDVLIPVSRKAYYYWVLFYYSLNRWAAPPPVYYLRYVRSNNPAGRPGHPPRGNIEIKKRADGARNFSDYTEAYFLEGTVRFENYDYFQGRVRKEDMGSAALYGFGVGSFKQAQQIFPETTFEDQVRTVLQHAARKPRYMADVGCGLGALAALYLACGVKVDAVDPSPASQAQVTKTLETFTKKTVPSYGGNIRFLNMTLFKYLSEVQNSPDFPDTWIFVESVEHIPRHETLALARLLKTRKDCRLIITNAVDLHPIHPDNTGWNHITRVDDAFYAELTQMATTKVLQAGSHLVLEF